MASLVRRFLHKYAVELVAIAVGIVVTVCLFNLGFTR